jgi:hypothetical protein
MATGVLKARVGGAWVPIGSQGSLPAHAIMHMAGGADALRLDTLAAPSDSTTLNATAAAHGLLPKLSGSASQFLNGLGLWAAAGEMSGPGTSVIDDLAAYATTTGKVLKDSGIPLSQVARLDSTVTFVGDLTARSLTTSNTGWGSIGLVHTDSAVDRRNAQIYYASGNFVIRTMSDNWATQLGYILMDYAGNVQTSGIINAAGSLKIGNDGNWPSIQFLSTYLVFNNKNGTQLGWWHETGVFQINNSQLRFGTALFQVQNAGGTGVLTVSDTGVVTCPYYLVIPVGTDRWAP